MTRNLNPLLCYLALVVVAASVTATAQVTPVDEPTVTAPVSYASVSQVNNLLSQLEQASQTAQVDLAKLRVDRWKTDSGSKKQTQGNVDSLGRNLQNALPGIIGEVRTSPDNLLSTFKLYRNVDALYDVMGSVVEATGAFGSKDEFQTLANDMTSLEGLRRSIADRMETLAGAKEVELTRLHNLQRSAQAAANTAPPKKVVVDDTAPLKKPVKKAVPKPPAGAAPKS